ncbi:MAG: hypothetical protein ACK4HV_07045, partial [Parachlamydiaceae bacterium]
YFSDTPSFDPKAYENIKEGDLVWVKFKFIPQFCIEVLPLIQNHFILLISDGDETFASDLKCDPLINELVENDKVIHLFVQNNDIGQNPKITSIPIGIDFHTCAYKGESGGWGIKGTPREQEKLLLSILSKAKLTYMRKVKAFVDFQHSDSMHAELNRYLQFGEDRTSIYNQIVKSGVVDSSRWQKRDDLWRTKTQYAFSVSPHGNGLDCRRTWEDLALGCIVIVKTSPLDVLYEGLPVVIIRDWSKTNKKNFDKWLDQYGDAFTNPAYRERLSTAYWMNKIKKISESYKAK